MNQWEANQMSAQKKDKAEIDYKELADKITEVQKSFSVDQTTGTMTTDTSGYTGNLIPGNTWHTHPIQPNYYGPQPSLPYIPPSTPLPHFNLGSEEDNKELLAMIGALGIEPTEDYLGPDMKLVIGEKWYSFTELLVKQMQFMTRVNILLCHRGSNDDEN